MNKYYYFYLFKQKVSIIFVWIIVPLMLAAFFLSLTFENTDERINGTIQSVGLIGKGRNVNTEAMVSLGIKLDNSLIINRSIPARLTPKIGDVIEFQVQVSSITMLKKYLPVKLNDVEMLVNL